MTHLFIGADNDLVNAALIEFIAKHFPEYVSKGEKQLEDIQHPDFHLLNGYEEESLGIERIKGFTKQLHKKPFKSKVQLGVIVGFENTTTEAQNASLKELEDHTSQVVYLLGAAEEAPLLPTIKSRATLHYITGVGTKKQQKELVELASIFTSKKIDVIDCYNKVTTKEWSRGMAEAFLKEFYEQAARVPSKELLQLLQKCSEYLQNNVSPKHVILYLLFALQNQSS